MRRTAAISIIPVTFAADVLPGDDLVEKLRLALRHQKLSLKNGDILVIKHKIVSKAESRMAPLAGVTASSEARLWARESGGDARLIQLVLSESRRVIRKKVVGGRGVLIAETRHGFVCANSG